MTPRLTIGLVSCLLLAGCSSDSEGTDGVSDEAFCAALDDWTASTMDAAMAMNELVAGVSESEDFGNLDDLPSADDMHTAAAQILSSIQEADDLLPTIVANISDPDVADDFEEGHGILLDMLALAGENARDTESFLDFLAAFLSDYDTFVDLNSSFEALDSAALDLYVATTCPDRVDNFGNQPGAVYDTNAKADVSTLGKEIAMYYVDSVEPDPVITIEDGRYYLLDTDIGSVREGNRITDQYYDSPIDWCVEITNDRGFLKTFTYSAQEGLQNGTCR